MDTRRGGEVAMVGDEDDTEVLRALQALAADGDDLRRLEEPLDTFNIFEALGDTRAELRHSHFLWFLLDAEQPHGLDDAFVRRLLGQVLGTVAHDAEQEPSIALGERQRGPWQVQREFPFGDASRARGRVDIMLLNPSVRVAVIIENKIDAPERPGQLALYYKEARRAYPGWTVFGLYLTPLGLKLPVHKNDRAVYRPLGYTAIRAAVEDLLAQPDLNLAPDVRTLMRHYSEIVRRAVVGEFDTDLLCQQLYVKHHQAIAILHDFVEERQRQVRSILTELITQDKRFVLERYEPNWVTFSVRDWHVAALREKPPAPYTHSLLFDFEDHLYKIDLSLEVQDTKDTRLLGLFEMASAHQPPFAVTTEPVKWQPIYHRMILEPDFYAVTPWEQVIDAIYQAWRAFLTDDFPAIDAAVKEWVTA